jgi:hypothetical protein
MKRLLAFILLFSYSVATTGTSLQWHFCMGERSDVKWNKTSGKKTCGKCGMEKREKPNGCCKDEHKWFKIQDDQKANTYAFQLLQLQPAAPVTVNDYNFTPSLSGIDGLLPDSHAPPRSWAIAIFKRNCVFRI